jgi:hypothetical protein
MAFQRNRIMRNLIRLQSSGSCKPMYKFGTSSLTFWKVMLHSDGQILKQARKLTPETDECSSKSLQ